MSTHRSGKRGPHTPEGKLASSKNSKKHGLTSKKLDDPADIQLAQKWENEINDYYQPQSPFAKILSRQIATYVVQSQRIKQVEQLELQQKIYDLEHSPKIILETMPSIKGTVKGMLLELIQFKRIQLPCNLSHEDLKTIAAEINQFYGEITCEEDVIEAFPKLVEYLNAQSFSKEGEGLAIDEKLKIISDRIQRVLDSGESYFEYFKKLVVDQKKPEPPEEITDHDMAIMAHVQRKRDEFNERYARYREPKPIEKKFASHATMMGILNSFVDLFTCLLQVVQAKKSFDQKKEFMIASVTLPESRSDTLMRYQTTVDRRLSALMAEYLVIQDRDNLAG